MCAVVVWHYLKYSLLQKNIFLGIIKFQRISLIYEIIFLFKRIASSRLKSRWKGQWNFHWDLKTNVMVISHILTNIKSPTSTCPQHLCYFSNGYIDVGDGCLRRNMMATTLRCWWQFWLCLSPTQSHQHPLVTNTYEAFRI